jgi:hypothetical protein
VVKTLQILVAQLVFAENTDPAKTKKILDAVLAAAS